MDGIRIQCAKLLSHGLAVAVGVGGGWLLLGLRASKKSGLAGDPPPVPEPEVSAAAWVDRTLLTMREKEQAAKAAVVDLEKLSVPELLLYQRREADRKRGELDVRVAAIILAAPRYQRVTDPAGAIAAAFRRETSADEALAVFQSWLDRDPDAALAHLRRNWRLTADLEPVPVLLERKFGREWQLARLADEATPPRMKRMLAAGIGQALGWHAGLAEALKASRKLADSDLADLLMENFVGAWPLAEPATVAGLLAGKLPADDRHRLLDSWVPNGLIDPFSDGFIAWDASRVSNFEWFRQVRDALPAELVPEDLRGITATSPDELEQEVRFDFAGAIAKRVALGISPENAVYAPIRGRVREILEQHPVLLDDYAAGRLSRRELLDQLCAQLPGAEAYPVELAQMAWLDGASRVEPQVLMKWATELPPQGRYDEVLADGVEANAAAEPRARYSLERYRLFFGKDGGVADLADPSQTPNLAARLSTWLQWNWISPQAATAWRTALPPGDPVGAELDRHEEATDDPSDPP
jgi:hypothetical protein